MIIQKARDLQTIKSLGPIRKHYWNGAHYLHLGIKFFVLFYPKVRVPGIFFYFPEELVATHHFRIAFFVVLQINEVTIPKFVAPVRKLFRKNMSMTVDLQHRSK